jgi:hypothetical protein
MAEYQYADAGDCPVGHFRKILCRVDFSPNSLAALDLAKDVAQKYQAKLYLLLSTFNGRHERALIECGCRTSTSYQETLRWNSARWSCPSISHKEERG